MKITTGLNPYGLTWYLGLQGAGTPRHNPNGVGLGGFIRLTQELGGKAIELWDGWLRDKSDAELASLRQRLDDLGWKRVISSGLQQGDMDMLIRVARALDARFIRVALTPILCGDRAAAGQRWHELVRSVHEKLEAAVPKLEAADVVLLIENHQDFTSRELVGLCEEYGPHVRIVFDMANTFPVAESPLDFTRVIAPYVRHCHVKDYRVHFEPDGFRLVRCPSGDGCVPHKEMFDILAKHNDEMVACIEIGALEARHVKLYTPEWWHGYAPKEAEALAACLLAAHKNRFAEGDDWRTPWERNADHELIEYELGQYRKSAANLKALGLM
ncbi:TIM barrel protein [Devosia sp.]|uniref:sugar phosphate isomerase/epimerase family protein n=1 Tax=Devosia sp. TaxID=1871048 RepID=UPI001ACA4F4D|nr:TIM barrel protein [Devosia sp.]MBN9310084.1 sugar phosphate isomerase/epimerase [Devosia sp.]